MNFSNGTKRFKKQPKYQKLSNQGIHNQYLYSGQSENN